MSPFVDMRQKELSRFGGTGIHERLVAPVGEAAHKRKKLEQKTAELVNNGTVDDIFSCFSKPDKLKPCSPEGLGRFVEQTFLKASKAMQP